MRHFAILVLSFLFSAGASAAPVKLTDAQMDAISAGRVVTVMATAAAPGEIAIALADTSTRLRARRQIGVTIGRRLAVAVGSRSAATGVDLFAEGNILRARTPGFRFVTKDALIFSKTISFVFLIEVHNRQVENVRFIRTRGPGRSISHRVGIRRAG